jgi:hypothetical protein
MKILKNESTSKQPPVKTGGINWFRLRLPAYRRIFPSTSLTGGIEIGTNKMWLRTRSSAAV